MCIRDRIRFDSSRGFETGISRLLRARFWIYAAVMAALLGLFVVRAGDRKPFSVTVTRTRGLPFTIDEGIIRNHYSMSLQNKTDRVRVYLVGPAEGALAGREGLEVLVPQERIELAPLSDAPVTLFAMMPRTSYVAPEDFHFTFRDSASGIADDVKVRFRGP